MEARTRGNSNRCFQYPMGRSTELSVSSFGVIPMCLKKVMQEQVDCFLIAPVGRSWPWYPALLSMLMERPLLWPQGQRILKLPGTGNIHPLCCQKKIPVSCLEATQPNNMVVLGKAGVADIVGKGLIFFLQL